MRTFHRLSLFLAMAMLPAVASAADRNGIQLQVAGLFGSPSGTYASAGDAPLSEFFAAGPGFGVTGTLGVTRMFHAGVRYGVVRSAKESSYTFDDLTLPGGATPPGSGPFGARRTLTVSEFAGILEYRRPLRQGAHLFLEAGGGLLTFSERVKVTEGGTDILTIGGYQQEPMWTMGAGASIRVAKNFDLVMSGRWNQAMTGDGDIWSSGDDPAFAVASIGLRYPNY